MCRLFINGEERINLWYCLFWGCFFKCHAPCSRVWGYLLVLETVLVFYMDYGMMMIKLVKIDYGLSPIFFRGILTYSRLVSLVCVVLLDCKEPNPPLHAQMGIYVVFYCHRFFVIAYVKIENLNSEQTIDFSD